MPRLRTRPPLFRTKKSQVSTNSVKKNVSNVSLGGRDSSDENFLLDSYRSGFKSTQQLELDFSEFKNHTFFSPARAKVDISLYKSINEYPFTGSISEIDRFLARLTGFERYVFDSIPRNIGYLLFSGTQPGETSGGTSISVKPYAGNLFPEVPGATGAQSLKINNNPFEIELYLYVPEISNENQIVTQRVQSEAGFTLALSRSAALDSCNLIFLVSSASDSYVVASGSIQKGVFSHIRACLFEENDAKKALLYANSKFIASSSDSQDFGILGFDTSSLLIGSGSQHQILDYEFSPAQTLSGAIDEFRFFSNKRKDSIVDNFKDQQMFATGGLELYFRFDEPFGTYDMNSIVLDYSGHCLHSQILNFTQSLRETGSIAVPMTRQNKYYSPILYPDFPDFNSYISDLIVTASIYDIQNPNVVTRLVPIHHLNESALAVGLPNFDSGLGVVPVLESLPGTGELPASSPLIRILTLMSISLDEIKQFVDSMSTLLAIELGEEEKLSSQMIKFAADYFGMDLPNFYAKSSTSQFSFGENISDSGVAEYTLRSLRDELWRRILANMPYANSAKGTKSAIRSIFLSSGIIPENFFVIRELGMSGETRLADLRDYSSEVTSMLDFSSSLRNSTGSFVSPGVRQDSPRIISPFLSGSRTEIGFPGIQGSFVLKDQFPPHGISNSPDDGLFTSGSFSLEASVAFDAKINHPQSQSILRILTTGSASPYDYLAGNLIYNQTSAGTGSLIFAMRPSMEPGSVSPEPLVLSINNINLFDGERWTVGIEKIRSDVYGTTSSSFTLRCAKQTGNYLDFFSTSSFYSETAITPNLGAFTNLSPLYNASGSYIMVGSQSLGPSTRFLNGYSDYKYSNFTGKISNLRFYSSKTGNRSFIEHTRNFSNIGLENPEIGLGFDLVQTGAFERIRIDASFDQATTSSSGAGDIRIFDFSQNSLHLSGSGFISNGQVILPYLSSINRISPRFDLQQSDMKVRPRGLNVPNENDPEYTITGPAYEIYDVQDIVDDTRFSIEHSIVKALNEDIVSTVGDAQYFENSLGNPNLMFSDTYPALDHFSNVYFNRLTGKMDLLRTYEVFRWVDTALTNLVESMLPKRTKFLGINYIVESSLLERGKLRFRSEDMFILSQIDPESDPGLASSVSEVVSVETIEGNVRRL